MTDGELVGDVEQGTLVGAAEFRLDQLAALFKDADQGDEGGALVLNGRVPSPEQGDGVMHTCGRVAVIGCAWLMASASSAERPSSEVATSRPWSSPLSASR